jgi:translation initiation factor 4G
MTSISPQTQIPPQASSSKTTETSPQSPASPTPTATTSSLTAGSTSSTARSYASATATKTQVAAPLVSSSSATTSSGPVGGSTSSAQHGKSSSISPINGKPSIPPAVPNMPAGPTIVNSSNAINGDRARKSSIPAGGPVSSMSNGGPPAQPSNNRNSIIQFGSMGGSPAADYSVPRDASAPNVPIQSNPRVTSPQNSPSPIPLPTASGGRPPSALQGHANNMSFGSTGGEALENVSGMKTS